MLAQLERDQHGIRDNVFKALSNVKSEYMLTPVPQKGTDIVPAAAHILIDVPGGKAREADEELMSIEGVSHMAP